MNQCTKRMVGILVGVTAWWFFLMQEEFAFYGIYSVVSYGIHEISILIPLACLAATGIWIFKMVKQLIQKKLRRLINVSRFTSGFIAGTDRIFPCREPKNISYEDCDR